MNATCEIADYLAHNVQLRVMLILRVVIASTGFVLLIALFRVQGTYLMFHSNVRVLMYSHHFWLIIQCLGNILLHLTNLIRFSRDDGDPCQYVVTTAFTVLIRSPTIFSLYGQVWSLASLAIERLYATIRYHDYETRGRKLGMELVIAQFLLTGLYIYILLNGLVMSDLKSYMIVSSSKTSGTTSNLTFSLAVVEVISFSTFCGLLWYNRRKKIHLDTAAALTEKYQINENIRATQLMIPMILTHFCCFMPTLIIFPVYQKVNPNVETKDYSILVETFNTYPIYCVCLPVVLFWRHKVLRQNLRKALLGVNEIAPDAPPDILLTSHFDMLKKMWKEPNEYNHVNRH